MLRLWTCRKCPVRSALSAHPRGRLVQPFNSVGPAFTYEDVSVLDLGLTGKEVPATVGAGDRLRFVADVGEFNVAQCLFYLAPVSTETR
ncbi:DUF4839 domain-containing protein [Streptomyces sp. SP18BB07]|uniref:DUF4839 domain-containing protein n=1 Tax=Streptomyces sp. SP18BB07 TaxID=3002522 RepID=UPI002E776B4C|nr:DUF4839 domain-containing protein [Streptomyces sp. SP18BB07]MEE1764211.1 DUF4839 domain-containing protein [Streptomyces sp. SP18BB07]